MGKGNILIPLDRVEELENRIQDVPLVLLNGSWVREEDENGNLLYYRQDVEVKGLSADSTPMIFPKWAGEEPVEEELNAYDCLIGEPIITEGNIRFMANPMPQWSFTMVAKGAMAAEGQDIDAVAGLVAKMNELETEVDVLNRNYDYTISASDSSKVTTIHQICKVKNSQCNFSFDCLLSDTTISLTSILLKGLPRPLQAGSQISYFLGRARNTASGAETPLIIGVSALGELAVFGFEPGYTVNGLAALNGYNQISGNGSYRVVE